MPETRYVRYADRIALTRLLDSLESGQVLQLSARRSQFTTESESKTYGWVKLREASQYGMNIDFMSLWHGGFVKKNILDLLESTKLVDACVQTLDVLVKDEQLGRAFADLCNDRVSAGNSSGWSASRSTRYAGSSRTARTRSTSGLCSNRMVAGSWVLSQRA